MRSVARRIVDGAMLRLIKMWLEAPVEETDEQAKKRVQRICAGISELTRRGQTQREAETLVADLNRRLIGWANYFCLGPVSKAYRAVERHTRRRLRQWLCAKHQRPGQGIGRYSD